MIKSRARNLKNKQTDKNKNPFAQLHAKIYQQLIIKPFPSFNKSKQFQYKNHKKKITANEADPCFQKKGEISKQKTFF